MSPEELVRIMVSNGTTQPDPRLETVVRQIERKLDAVRRRRFPMVPPQLAEDARQNALANLFRQGTLHRLRSLDGSKVFGFIVVVFLNAMRQELRRTRWLVLEPPGPGWDDVRDPGPSVEVTVAQRRRAEALRRALDRMAPTWRTVLLLRFEAGLSGEEIAERIEKSHAAVRTILSRARERLRREIEKELSS